MYNHASCRIVVGKNACICTAKASQPRTVLTMQFENETSSKLNLHSAENLELGEINQGFYEKTSSNKGSVFRNIETNPSFHSPIQPSSTTTSNSAWSHAPHSRPLGHVNGGKKETMGLPRETWDNQIEFLLSCIAMSVGLGNVWRFPFTAYENGGGAFLIPYLIVLVIFGRPMYFLEMCLGQFSSYGPVKLWKISPFFQGIGFASGLAIFCTLSFYCSIVAITFQYLIVSFANPLPWSEQTCNQTSTTNELCEAYRVENRSFSELYYFTTIFPQLKNIDNGIGTPHWNLVACLAAVWVITFLCIVKGIKSSGKASYFIATFPYVVLITLLVRGLTLPGSMDGIYYLIKPQWNKIWEPKVWVAAITQSFFSLNVGFGTISYLSSHNKFRHNIFRDAIVISVIDTFTSCLAGCTIFAMLGYLAETMGVDISEVTRGGPGLAFIAFPEILSSLNWCPQLFSVLFFLMFLTLGIGSVQAATGQIVTIIRDQYPTLKKWKVGFSVCFLGFATGIVFCTPGGQFILTLVNHNGADVIIYITAMLEITAIAWIYGVNKFAEDIKFMLGRETELYWKICWMIMPLELFALLVYYFAEYDGDAHDGVPFPLAASVSGWILTGLILSALPICALSAVWKSPGNTWMTKLKSSLKPKPSWGPKEEGERAAWLGVQSRHKEMSGKNTLA